MQMEESSNGKMKVTQKVEFHEDEEQQGKEVFDEEAKESNQVGESGRDIDIVDVSEFPNKRVVKIEDFSEPVDNTLQTKDWSSSSSSSDEEKETAKEEKSPKLLDSEEEKQIPDDNPVEHPVDSEPNERNEDETDFPSKEIHGKPLPNSEKGNELPSKISSSENENESVVNTSVVAREENIGEPSSNVDNGDGVCDKTEISESRVSPPVVSVNRSSLEPTSWKSCCGLFDVLRSER